jgi:hypothetical protein
VSAPKDRIPPHTSSKKTTSITCIHALPCKLRPHLPIEVGSGAAMCPTAPDLTSLLRWVSVLPRGSWSQASSSCWVELRCRHAFLSSGPHLPAEVASSAATCPMAPGFASSRGELRHCHVFLSSGSRLPTKVGSGAATWPRPYLPERRAPVLPRTPRPPAGCVPQE